MASRLSTSAVIAVVGTAAVFVACASFTSADEPSGAQTDGGPTGDAGDASSSPDAADSATPADASLSCATATFCADFEKAPPDQGLAVVSDTSSVTHSLISAGHAGSMQAVRFAVEATSYDNEVHYLRKVFGIPNATVLSVQLAMRIASAPVSNNMQVATIGWGPSTDEDKPSEIQIRLENDRILAKHDEDPSPSVDLYGTSSFLYVRDVWFDVAVNLVFNGRAVVVQVTADGQTLMAKTFTALSDPVDPDVAIGIAGIDGDVGGPVTVDYDDLVVYAK